MTYIYDPVPKVGVSYFLHDDHREILHLVKKLSSMLPSRPETQSVLQQLRWRVGRHLYLEENAIFLFFRLIRDTMDKETRHHIHDHDQLQAMLNSLLHQHEPEWEITFHRFKVAYSHHHQFAQNSLYPLLETVLTYQQQHYLTEQLMKAREFGYYSLPHLRAHYHFT